MLGALISLAVGGLMVFVAVQALRGGELATGETALRRGDPLFLPAIGALALGGLGLGAWTVWVVSEDVSLARQPPQRIEGDGWRAAVPPRWERLPAEGMPPDATLWGDGRGELMVTRSRGPLPATRAANVGELLRETVPGPSVSDRPPIFTETSTSLAATFDYSSPRGPVRSRLLGWVTGDEVHLVVAVCTDGAESGVCGEVIDSLVGGETGVPLATPLPPVSAQAPSAAPSPH